jgi:hypothetical protein
MLNGSAHIYNDNIIKLEWQTRSHVNDSRLNHLHDLRAELPDHHQMIIDIKKDDHDLTDNQSRSTDESKGE